MRKLLAALALLLFPTAAWAQITCPAPVGPGRVVGDVSTGLSNSFSYYETGATITSPRTWTLPLASSVNQFCMMVFSDQFGGITPQNPITIAGGVSQAGVQDTIGGNPTASLNSRYAVLFLQSGGAGKWVVANATTSLFNGAQSVPTNTVLKAAFTAFYPNGVWRSDFSAGLGAPPLFYQPSASKCSLNSGAGDNGSQVLSADGKCWLAVFSSDGVDVREFGADNTGTSNSAAAITAAAAFAATGNLQLRLVGGTYKANSSIAVTLPSGTQSFTVEGDGADVTVLNFPNANDGLTINLANEFSSFHVDGLTVATGQAGGGNGLTINQAATTSVPYGARSSIDQVNFRDSVGYATGTTHYWTKAIKLNGVGWVDINNVNIQGAQTSAYVTTGTCASLEGGTASLTPVIINFRSFQCFQMGVGIEVGAYYQGITVDEGSNFVGGQYGIHVASVNGIDQINVVGAQFNMNGAGIRIDSDVSHQIGNLQVTGALFLVTTSAVGINDTGGLGGATIVGNTFQQIDTANSGTGLFIDNDISGNTGLISGNHFYGLSTSLDLGGGSQGWQVSGNRFHNNTFAVTNDGSSTLGSDLPWTDYTPTIACNSGFLSLATVSGHYSVIGATVNLELSLQIGASGIGTCAGFVTLSLPPGLAPTVDGIVSGRDIAVTGATVVGSIVVSTGVAALVKYDGSTPVANGYNVQLTGQYQIIPQ